ncbi:1-acyl-sn-glycerol-3-phosphate acyltransferase [Polynucleobacter sp. 86C-FISCH]|uniref:lysophospholipid acyltransferase family protein n=1 Tax=Polynucleobacter sp. 86C-FISCH TaxID=2689101 RepID=UPI001C0B9FEA|nr:lysophospholipid acyltransferase family protein [Polynucleobacter sp. 86C-FISCH]MBU3594794.1 1-acyl-sn-glycerol-3-phosphate acyltransferase [Polynucleobacter sp. 86C-FISCH]
MERKTSFITQFVLWVAIAVHVLSGIFILSFIFPFAREKNKRAHIQKWSRRLLKILGIELLVINSEAPPKFSYLLVSNHISWVDIHAINAFKPTRFVAKSEVEKWPIFGWMAKKLGTVFIRRNSSKHAHFVVSEISKVLKTESICIFPEGTSTSGEYVLPFKPNLFESAIMADVPVCPLAIHYLSKENGKRSEIPAFVGDMGLLESMKNILSNHNLVVELTFLAQPVLSLEQAKDRKMLAFNSHKQISEALKLTATN